MKVFESRPARLALVLVVVLVAKMEAHPATFLFDATKAEMAGNADWVIDADFRNLRVSAASYGSGVPDVGGTESNPQRIPTLTAAGITAGTPETYWNGAISAWAVDLVKRGHAVESLPYNGRITFQDPTNPQDLTNYQAFVLVEPNILFTAAEKAAIINFVFSGGALFMVSDHIVSDRNNDGADSVGILNDLMTNSVANNPFGIRFNTDNFVLTSAEVDNTPGNLFTFGPAGTGTSLAYHNGATMTLNTNHNASVRAAVWKDFPHTSNNVMLAYANFGTGRVVAFGDSSPFDDGTGDPNDTLYFGYDEATDREFILNSSLWLVGRPRITSQPQGLTVNQESNVTFSVTVSGEAALFYRWRKDGVNLSNGMGVSGVTTSSLTLSNVTLGSSGNYQVVITNAYGSVTSSVAALTVSEAPEFFTVLKHFSGSDGMYPYDGLVLSGNTLFGTTSGGGNSGYGTVFKVNVNGTGFAVLKHFTGADGRNPYASLTLYGNTLYGTTQSGGSTGNGTVFKLNTDGTGYTVLRHFAATGGRNPWARLTLADGVLYGTTAGDSTFGNGVVFKVGTNGTGYSVLKQFSGSDGSWPQARLALSGSTLYGTTYQGGGYGNVFKLSTNGSGYVVLTNLFGSGGSSPSAELVLSGDTLFGTAWGGGSADRGTVFRMNVDGSGFAALKHFTGSDGGYPDAGLLLSGNTLYGTTTDGGSSGNGTVFKVNTDGTGFAALKHFAGLDGRYPMSGLIHAGSFLYGTTAYGGDSGFGTVFRINLAPIITAQPIGGLAKPGTNVTFMPAVTGEPPFAFQWFVHGAALPGATNITLTLADVQPGDSGNYLLLVSNRWGAATSATAALAVTTASYNQTTLRSLPGGQIEATYLGNPGFDYCLEWTHDLSSPVTWTPLQTNQASTIGLVLFTNIPSLPGPDFYRTRRLP